MEKVDVGPSSYAAESPSRQSTTARIAVIWFFSRIYIALVGVFAASGLISQFGFIDGFLSSWRYFDTLCYENIVQYGYLGSDFCFDNTAFFPGLPTLMFLGDAIGLNTTVTAMVASFFASLAAGIALGKIAELMGIRPELTVAIWFMAPMAVFLFAPYTEAIFAAFSFWSWYFAKKSNWVMAGVLAGFAAFVRSNGIFLGIALIAIFLLSENRNWKKAPFLLLPFFVILIYFAYLYTLTGSWTHWFDAQASGWDRSFTDPITASINTIRMGLEAPENGLTLSRMLSEFVNTYIVLGVGIAMLFKRWWAESIYIFVTMASLVTSNYFQSTMRATLILLPVWLYFGMVASKSRWVAATYFVVSVPFLTLIVTRYVDGQWIS